MIAQIFDRTAHTHIIAHWLEARGMDLALIDDLPVCGYVTFHEDKPVAAGFLRAVEGKHAIADSFITDPTAKPELRHEAMDKTLDAILDMAATLKLKSVIAYSKDLNTQCRARSHGFVQQEYAVMTLNFVNR